MEGPQQNPQQSLQREQESPKLKEDELLQLGYYAIRGKAQYLRIPYKDTLFELKEWDLFKKEQLTKPDQKWKWDFADLPYLRDRDFILTEAFPICQYILQKYNAMQILGRNKPDKAIIQMYLWTIDTMGSIISINCTRKEQKESQMFKQKQWHTLVLPRLLKYENFSQKSQSPSTESSWFLGYLTIIDFSIYELVRYLNMLFPNKLEGLSRLNRIKDAIEHLPEIMAYENSQRAIKQMDPNTLLTKFRNATKQETNP